MKKVYNPLRDLISDDIFVLLYSLGIILDKDIRNYQIRKQFRTLRNKKISVDQAISRIMKKYKCLHQDTIRKIAYGKPTAVS